LCFSTFSPLCQRQFVSSDLVMNRENKKGMVSLGSLSGGSGKPAIDKHDGYIGKAKNRGQTPNDPHPIGVSVRLIPR